MFTINFRSPELTAQLQALTTEVANLKTEVAVLTKQLVRMSRPSPPTGLRAIQQGERVMASKKFLTYSVQANPPSDPTVVTRRLKLAIDGGEPTVKDYAKDAAFENFEVPAGAAVVLTLSDLDDVNNESAPDTFSFTAEDTIPPAAPSGLAVQAVSERVEEVTE